MSVVQPKKKLSLKNVLEKNYKIHWCVKFNIRKQKKIINSNGPKGILKKTKKLDLLILYLREVDDYPEAPDELIFFFFLDSL